MYPKNLHPNPESIIPISNMALTPMTRQYLEVKERCKDCIVFFRMGDFYEMFFEDAVTASKILEIALTTRDKSKADPVPMCGVPYHSASQYIQKLLKKGYKVAVCEQVEDPKDSKGIVAREVVKVITPGVPVDADSIDPKDFNYLVSLVPNGRIWGVAYVDPTIGDLCFTVTRDEDELKSELNRIAPKEVLLPQAVKRTGMPEMIGRFLDNPFITYIKDTSYNYNDLLGILKEHFGEGWLCSVNGDDFKEGLTAGGVLLTYLKETQKRSPLYVKPPVIYRVKEYMVIDPMTRKNLELTESLRTGSVQRSLLKVIDRTRTAMGGRRLREWIAFPLLKTADIRERLDAVEEFKKERLIRGEIIEELKGVYDLERLVNRVILNTAGPRDVVSLKESLKRIPKIKTLLKGVETDYVKRIYANLAEHGSTVELIGQAVVDNPPSSLRDGGVIREGYNAELDKLRDINRSGKEWILRLERGERERTGINSLKVGYNRVFGYYIEVTKANLSQVPDSYIRRQTLVNAERFVTQELKEYESKVLNAQERMVCLETSLFNDLLERINNHAKGIQNTAYFVGILDCLISLSQVADERRYVKPDIDEGDVIHIVDGRHPVVETMALSEGFVANDTLLDCDENRLLIITGPNMAGKSTYIRQSALICLMAQIGSFVPAVEAHIGVVDRIFARIGAMDDISKGQSTFMVEMNETAHILRFATRRSLIILDEIGRGTSTFDGISIAWAVAEYIHDHPSLGAKTLFATHYHELTELSLVKEGVKNYHVSVREWNDRIIFLRKILSGGTNRSYGIQVARLAGISEDIIGRAKEILANLEKGELDCRGMPRFAEGDDSKERKAQGQLNLFSTPLHPAFEVIKGLDIDMLTPLEALNKIHYLKRLVEEQQT